MGCNESKTSDTTAANEEPSPSNDAETIIQSEKLSKTTLATQKAEAVDNSTAKSVTAAATATPVETASDPTPVVQAEAASEAAPAAEADAPAAAAVLVAETTAPAPAATPETSEPVTFKYTAPDGKGFNNSGEYRKYVKTQGFYKFSQRENEFLCKKSGQIDGQAFNMSHLTNCEVQLLDHSDQVLADYLKDCRVFIGPSSGSVFLRNCENCSITVAAKQLRTRDCKNCRFYVYSKTEPVIEMTEDVEIRRFNGQYEGMDAHFEAANLSRNVDNWDKIHDFSKRDKDLGPEPHFKLIKLVPTAWMLTGEATTERPRLTSTS